MTIILGKDFEYSGIKCSKCGEDFIWNIREKEFLSHKCGKINPEISTDTIKPKPENAEARDNETI